MSLVLCKCCHRHVKARDPECPFCGIKNHEASTAAVGVAMVLGLGLAVGGCSSSTTAPVLPDGTAAYGPVPYHEDAGKDAAHEKDVATKDAAREKDVATKDAREDRRPVTADAAYGPPPGWGWDDLKEAGA